MYFNPNPRLFIQYFSFKKLSNFSITKKIFMKLIFIMLATAFISISGLAQNTTIADSAYKTQALKKANTKIIIGTAAFVVGTAVAVIGFNQLGNKKNYSGIESSIKNSLGNTLLIGLGGALEVTGLILGIDGIVKHRKAKNLKIGSEVIYLPGYKQNIPSLKFVVTL